MKGWARLTDIQERSIEPILQGKNTIIVAPTGHGKTEAALLPILSRIVETNAKPIALLYITPMKALINDIYERVSWWAKRLNLIAARKHGDVPQRERSRRLKKTPHIMITTPESLEIDLDWAPKFRKNYANVQWVVVDEVHEIVSTKRGVQLAVLLERLRRMTGDYQLVLLSATVGSPNKVLEMFRGSSRRGSCVVVSSSAKPIRLTIDFVRSGEGSFWREAALKILEHVTPLTLVFVNSKHAAEMLHKEMENLGKHSVAVHHASISASEREYVERKAKSGEVDVIIATKTLELGIDVGSVERVILFRPAGSVSALLQRVGRSRHKAEAESYGVILATNELDLLEAIAEARLAVKGIVEEPEPPQKPLDVAARSLLGMALAGEYTVEDAYSILRSTFFFRDLTREEYSSLVDYLQANKLLKVRDDGRLQVGPRFYAIWRFEQNGAGAWWSRSFTEFFTHLTEQPTYTVRDQSGRPVGELDAEFVTRLVRVGDVIRLGGRSWKVIDIQEHERRILVAAVESEASSTPFWRGKGPEISTLVVSEIGKVIQELAKGNIQIPDSVEISTEAKEELNRIKRDISKSKVPPPSTEQVIVDYAEDEQVFLFIGGERLSRTLAYLVMSELPREEEVYVRISPIGFSVRTSEDVINILLSLRGDDLRERVLGAVARSPYFIEVASSIQVAFGKIDKLLESDSLVHQEALRQAASIYFDVDKAAKLIEGLRRGSIEILPIRGGEPTAYSRMVLSQPYEKPWIPRLTTLLVENLKGLALTVEEIAINLDLSEDRVEKLLRTLKKTRGRNRVFNFIDVDTMEVRWALVEDAEQVASLSEFAASFRPRRADELYMIIAKAENGASIQLVTKVSKLLENGDELLHKIPFDEISELRVVPLTSYFSAEAPRYKHIPKSLVPLLVLNAIAYIQKIQASDPLYF
ncbi:MAG: DEAD/DEAH box helicase [Thermoproteota archaeon]